MTIRYGRLVRFTFASLLAASLAIAGTQPNIARADTSFSDNFDQTDTNITNDWTTVAGTPQRVHSYNYPGPGEFVASLTGSSGDKALFLNGGGGGADSIEHEFATQGNTSLAVSFSVKTESLGPGEGLTVRYYLDGTLASTSVYMGDHSHLTLGGTIDNAARHTKLTVRFSATVSGSDDYIGVDAFSFTGSSSPNYYDGFESNDFTTGGWTNSGATVIASGANSWTGDNDASHTPHAANLDFTDSITKAFTTIGLHSIQFRYARATEDLEGGETFKARYSTDGGSSWTDVETVSGSGGGADSSYTTVWSNVLPAAANNNANFQLRFALRDSQFDDAYVDDVVIWGQPLPPAPTVSVPVGPTSPANTNTPSFTFETGGSPTTVQCRADLDAFVNCSSPYTTGVLADGDHTVTVRVADTYGQTDYATSSVLTIDTLAPTVSLSLTAPLASPTNHSPFSVTATFSEDVTGFNDFSQVNVLNGEPSNLQALDSQTYTFDVTPNGDGVISTTVLPASGADAAGNVNNEQSNTLQVTYDSEAPTLDLTQNPIIGGWASTTAVTFGFTTEEGALVECSLDGLATTTCATTVTYGSEGEPLAEGAHVFRVQATDDASNMAFIEVAFTVDRTAPTLETGSDITVPATDESGATVTFSNPSASDNLDSEPEVVCTPASGSLFPTGDTTVNCVATDAAGNSSEPTSFTVHVTGYDVYVDDSVEVSGDGTEEHPFKTITEGVEAVPTGGRVHVAEGTYAEQVLATRSMSLLGAGAVGTTWYAPEILSNDAETTDNLGLNILTISGESATVEVTGFTISGPGPGECGSIDTGIFVGGGATADIHDNAIVDIADSPLSGCQNGVGIRVGRQSLDTTGHATISDNTVSGYQKGGISVDNEGSDATITHNTVTGVGATPYIAQNGIQVSRGATATVTDNTVTGNMCDHESCGPDYYEDTSSVGVLLYEAGATTLSGNTVSGNDYGIFTDTTSGAATLEDNTITNNRYFGIVFSTGNVTVTGGSITNNPVGAFNPSDRDPSTNQPSLLGVVITDNSEFGVKNDREDYDVEATGNWWGSTTGPTVDTNPGGSGDAITHHVTYDPWCVNNTCTTSEPEAPAQTSGGSNGGGTVSGALSYGFTNLFGDLNGDGRVNEVDFSLLMAAWGQTGNAIPADLNKDGVVDFVDFSLLIAHWTF